MPRIWRGSGLSGLLSSWLDPAICFCCGRSEQPGRYFCADCLATIEPVLRPCTLCGLPNPDVGETCPACLYDPPRWQRIRAPKVYQNELRDLILQLKNGNHQAIARALVETFSSDYQGEPLPEALLPVPLHPARLKERGFNQALEIAREFGRILDIHVDNSVLSRVRATQVQAGLTANKREKNIRGAFAVADCGYRHVAIVDDIVTTGSTANEICRALNRAGIDTVEVWSLARVLKP